MSRWETPGASDEWYTPPHVFEALGATFDLDPAHPHARRTHVPCAAYLSQRGLEASWTGAAGNRLFVWLNPPFGGRNGLEPWLRRFFDHGNGIALTPDRSSAPWWQWSAIEADAVLFVGRKIRFLRPDGTEGRSPSTGTTLFAAGPRGVLALERAQARGLGLAFRRLAAA